MNRRPMESSRRSGSRSRIRRRSVGFVGAVLGAVVIVMPPVTLAGASGTEARAAETARGVTPRPVAAEKALPDFALQELGHLAETYRILDVTAAKTWPGWSNYRDFPFVFGYPNGLRVLVGHPNPPAGFEKIPGVRVEDKEVFADFSQVNTTPLHFPMIAGGGPLPLGTTKDGKPVKSVIMTFMSPEILKKGGYGIVRAPFSVELQILGYIHELFHCFQESAIKMDRVGNLMMNPDASYAAYSEIEGLALAAAYTARTPDAAAARIRDFLAARMLKARAGVPELQQRQEASDDLMEGTAVYSTVRALEILGTGYKTELDLAREPYYSGFKNVESLKKAYLEQLRRSAAEVYDIKGKCYDYGCFQALLLERYHPGWQQVFAEKVTSLAAELARYDPVGEQDLAAFEKRFAETYAFARVRARTAEAIRLRDDAYHALQARRGQVYIIDIKPILQYESQLYTDVPQYTLGLIHMYMKGVPAATAAETLISAVRVPIEGNQLYYLKVVDTGAKEGAAPYRIKGREKSEGVWEDAEIRTPLFTVKTPLVRIEQTPTRVKFVCLPVLQGSGDAKRP